MLFNVSVIIKELTFWIPWKILNAYSIFFMTHFCGKCHRHCVSPCTSMTNIGWPPNASLKETQDLCAKPWNFQNGHNENQVLHFASEPFLVKCQPWTGCILLHKQMEQYHGWFFKIVQTSVTVCTLSLVSYCTKSLWLDEDNQIRLFI